MRYWIVFIAYIFFIPFASYIGYAQGCATSEKEVITGAACSIKDLQRFNDENKKIKEPQIEKNIVKPSEKIKENNILKDKYTK